MLLNLGFALLLGSSQVRLGYLWSRFLNTHCWRSVPVWNRIISLILWVFWWWLIIFSHCLILLHYSSRRWRGPKWTVWGCCWGWHDLWLIGLSTVRMHKKGILKGSNPISKRFGARETDDATLVVDLLINNLVLLTTLNEVLTRIAKQRVMFFAIVFWLMRMGNFPQI